MSKIPNRIYVYKPADEEIGGGMYFKRPDLPFEEEPVEFVPADGLDLLGLASRLLRVRPGNAAEAAEAWDDIDRALLDVALALRKAHNLRNRTG